ncbi:MAG: 16S rRNA (guanine(527)-N(7))-methyltransferase RsmG [Alphaproteobacteria bacterium]|nr:16S rRNA (guanine(527)-N(7))-methyltransferase RsmG [Alphaproteobacteria bacterium]
MLVDWNSRHNLVSRGSLDDLWRRHFWDSAQLASHIPGTAGTRDMTLADMGSGAGFPGLVLAAMLRDRLKVTLFEATAKKSAFLTAAAARMELDVRVVNARMEDAPAQIFDVITSRACAPLPGLLAYAHRFTGPRTVCLFLKGRNVGEELTEAHKCWSMKVSQFPSLSDPSGAILEVRELEPHDRAPKKASHPGRRQPKGRRR